MLTQRIQAVQPSATLKITALAKKLKAQGKPVINLAGGEPDFDTPEPIKTAAIEAIQSGFTKYTPTTGIPELKKAVASALGKRIGITLDPTQIGVTAGAKQALYNILQILVQEGDEVLVPSPYWVSYPEMVRLAGAVPVEVKADPADGFKTTADQLRSKCTSKTRCLLLNSPSNPTGAVLLESDLKGIAELALEKDLWIVSDEIYAPLSFDGPAPSIASLSSQIAEKTIVVDGVSKAYAMTGWRIGFLAGPQELIAACGRLQDHSTSCPSSISQKAALAALTGDQSVVGEMAEAFKKRRDALVERVDRIEKLCLSRPPAGAFYAFADISATGLSSSDFSERLLKEAEVATVPGSGFGWDSHVRISFCIDQEKLLEGLDRTDQFIKGLQ